MGYLTSSVVQKVSPKLLNQKPFLSYFRSPWATNVCVGLVQARCRHFSNAKYSPDGVMDSSVQTLAPASQSFPLALQFPLFPLTTSVCCFIFCCNVYKAFLYVFSSKTNVKSAPLTCTAGLLCMWMQVFHTNTSVCVSSSFIAVWLCTPAEHSHTLTCQLDVDAVTDRRWTLEHRRHRAGFAKVP